VLILNGSGPLDRDSNMPGQALNVSVAIAEKLAAVGVASLRYDKRGVGESDGDYLSMGFDAETREAAVALDALRAIEGVDPARVGVIGHSVGATIAIRLARTGNGVTLAVLLCAAAQNGRDVMTWQSDRIAATLPGPDWLAPGWLRRRQRRDRERLASSTAASLRLHRTPVPALWFREYMAYDPTVDLVAIECPVLAMTGTKDLQVNPEDVARIGSAVAGPFTGETPKNLTHVLRSRPGRPSLWSYGKQLKQPVDDRLLTTIAAWTVAQVERPS
jgi:pimeloyl-ACP methyl ester carboxylesterase